MILTSLDIFGELLVERFPDEPLYLYKKRVIEAAKVAAKRDIADDFWSTKSAEMSALVGEAIVLEDKTMHPSLLDQWSDDKIWEALNKGGRWPVYQPIGRDPYYNTARSSDGVASGLEYQNGALSNGIVVVAGAAYFIGRSQPIVQELVANTYETVLLPWIVESPHPHTYTVINDTQIKCIGADGHEHTATIIDNQLVFDDNAHTTIPRPIPDSVYIYTSPYIVNPLTTPLLNSGSVFVTDSMGRFDYVERDAYLSGNYYLDGVKFEGHYSYNSVADFPDLDPVRPLVPICKAYNGTMFETDQTNSPYKLWYEIRDGWTIIKTYGESAVNATPFEKYVVLVPTDSPGPLVRPADNNLILGFGLDLPATRLFIQQQASNKLYIRSEDIYTGGVGNTRLVISYTTTNQTGQHVVKTNEKGDFTFYTADPITYAKVDLISEGVIIFSIDTTHNDSITSSDGYGTDYGEWYGS